MYDMQKLIAAGFTHGSNNKPGVDRTVASLEWALANLPNGGSTARTYAEEAARDLESRLMAAYVIQSLACLKSGNTALAHAEYKKAAVLNEFAQASDHRGVNAELINSALLQLAEWLRHAGIAV
jgi:hypothetical protein